MLCIAPCRTSMRCAVHRHAPMLASWAESGDVGACLHVSFHVRPRVLSASGQCGCPFGLAVRVTKAGASSKGCAGGLHCQDHWPLGARKDGKLSILESVGVCKFARTPPRKHAYITRTHTHTSMHTHSRTHADHATGTWNALGVQGYTPNQSATKCVCGVLRACLWRLVPVSHVCGAL